MTKTKDLNWLAGILEGEGCFSISQIDRYNYPKITMGMTDLDVISRVARILGTKVTGPYRVKEANRKLIYHISMLGKKAAHWMLVLLADMGERRQARILEIMAAWKRNRRAVTA